MSGCPAAELKAGCRPRPARQARKAPSSAAPAATEISCAVVAARASLLFTALGAVRREPGLVPGGGSADTLLPHLVGKLNLIDIPVR